MNRTMVLAEWRRAWQALHAAELLSSAGYHEDAMNYDAQMTFSSPEVQQECQRTREFLDRIRRYLLIQGFAENELGTGTSPS
jgi:hypothetical protein